MKSTKRYKNDNLKVRAEKASEQFFQQNECLSTVDSAIVGARSRKLNERVGVTKEFLADKDRDKPRLVHLV